MAETLTFPDKSFKQLKLDISEQAVSRNSEKLGRMLQNGSFVYGAGAFGRRVAAALSIQGFSCMGFIDQKSNILNQKIDNIPVFHPESLDGRMVSDRAFILGIHNHYVSAAEPLRLANGLGFSATLWNVDLPDVLGSSVNNYWLTSRQHLIGEFDEAVSAARQFSDLKSIEIFYNLLRYRGLNDVTAHPPFDIKTQYAPTDLPSFDKSITFIDGGAYDGDSYKNLLKSGIKVANWLAFEPDETNFDSLETFAGTVESHTKLFRAGLSSHIHQAYFQGESGTASHLTSKIGAHSASCVSLDDVIDDAIPDYIKLDIEGSESDALDGMKQIIKCHRPRLAVSVYHRPSDLWKLTRKVSELAQNYELYLRQHGANGFDTVLYAIPKKN